MRNFLRIVLSVAFLGVMANCHGCVGSNGATADDVQADDSADGIGTSPSGPDQGSDGIGTSPSGPGEGQLKAAHPDAGVDAGPANGIGTSPSGPTVDGLGTSPSVPREGGVIIQKK